MLQDFSTSFEQSQVFSEAKFVFTKLANLAVIFLCFTTKFDHLCVANECVLVCMPS